MIAANARALSDKVPNLSDFLDEASISIKQTSRTAWALVCSGFWITGQPDLVRCMEGWDSFLCQFPFLLLQGIALLSKHRASAS